MGARTYVLTDAGLAKLAAFAREAGAGVRRLRLVAEDLARTQPLVAGECVRVTVGSREMRLYLEDFDVVSISL